MSVAAQLAGLAGAVGLAVLLLARQRLARLAALVVWAASLGVVGLYLLPDLSRTVLAAALVGNPLDKVADWLIDTVLSRGAPDNVSLIIVKVL